MPTLVGQRHPELVTMLAGSAYAAFEVPDGVWDAIAIKCPGGLLGDKLVITGEIEGMVGACIAGVSSSLVEADLPSDMTFIFFGEHAANPTMFAPILRIFICDLNYDPVVQLTDTEFLVLLAKK